MTTRPVLTRVEYQILLLLADGKKTKEIAAARNVAVKTVETQFKTIRDRLGIANLCELRAIAAKHVAKGNRLAF